MNCIYGQTGKITICPSWEGVGVGCRECGHIYPNGEFGGLLARQLRSAASPPPCRLEGEPR